MASKNIPATEDQIEAKERKILDYEQKEFLAQHLILFSTSSHLSQRILSLTSAKDMWDAVKGIDGYRWDRPRSPGVATLEMESLDVVDFACAKSRRVGILHNLSDMYRKASAGFGLCLDRVPVAYHRSCERQVQLT
jgi:hypothetical protein